MNLERFLQSARQPALLANDTLAASRWEAQLAAPTDSRVSLTPPITTLPVFLNALWQRSGRSGLLQPHQSRALWLRVVEESRWSANLVGTARASTWAQSGWQLMTEWGAERSELAAGGLSRDEGAFRDWCLDYRARLDAEGWSDHPSVLQALNDGEIAYPGDLALLDFEERPPALEQFLRRQRDQSLKVVEIVPPAVKAIATAFAADSPADELRQAVTWACQKLDGEPTASVALVVPDLSQRRHELISLLDDAAAGHAGLAWWLQRGARLNELPRFGDALAAVRLLSPAGDFATLSRWLRSPAFTAREPTERCAMTEVGIRCRLEAQTPFVEAYHRYGLRAALERDVPIATAGLDRALARLDRARRTASPSGWAETWQHCLTDLGWRPDAGGTTERSVDAWASALQRFVELTPVVGEIGLERAVALLAGTIGETEIREPLPLAGLHVFEHPRHVGPGYRGVWLTDFTDRRWPEPARPNPLVPRRIQIDRDMPGASPERAYQASARWLDRISTRVAEAVFSWPGIRDEQIVEASSMLDGCLARISRDQRAPAPRFGRGSDRRGAIEVVADVAPPWAGSRVPGGARTLEHQARCPARAFCEARLGAVVVERPIRGLPPRLLGNVLHRSLETLLRPALEGGAAFTPETRLDDVEACVSGAFAALCRWRHPIGRVLIEQSGHRLSARIRDFIERESSREPFAIESLEHRFEIRIAGHDIAGRIDRIDQLADGELAILDYKTATAATPTDWFGERLADCQLPLYGVAIGERITALATVSFAGSGSRYSGRAAPTWKFPGRVPTLPADRAWPDQLRIWRAQLSALVEAFTAGDTRVPATGRRLAAGAYAPLTRVYEHDP